MKDKVSSSVKPIIPQEVFGTKKKDKVIVHLEVEDCIQDCPFCRALDTKTWMCVDYEPPMDLGKGSMTNPITPPPNCPFRSMG